MRMFDLKSSSSSFFVSAPLTLSGDMLPISRHVMNSWSCMASGEDTLYTISDLLDGADVKGHDQSGHAHHHDGQGKPDGGDDELAPHLLVDGDRQGHHHVALVLQQIFIEPLNHHHHAHDAHGNDGDAKGHHQQAAQKVQHLVVCLQQGSSDS